jgi:cell division protein ZipA
MDPFRLILLLIGAAIIAAIYLWDRWRRRQPKHDPLFDDELPQDADRAAHSDEDWDVIPLLRHAVRGAPVEEAQLREFAGFNGREAKAAVAADEAREVLGSVSTRDDEQASQPAEQLLVFSVIAQEGEVFTGPTLSDLFEQLGLQYGDMRIFHRMDADSGEAVFSVVSIIEPGYFELENLPELRTPGLALFMRLPGPVVGAAAFEDMYATARALAGALEGRLGDQQRRPLTEDSLAHMRAQARPFRSNALA